MLLVKGIISGVLALILIPAGLIYYGERSWQADTAELLRTMEAARLEEWEGAKYFRAEDLAGLPTPVERYLRTVLKDGQPLVAAVTLKHAGTFNMGTDSDKWTPFTSTQHVVTNRPGFVWDARNRISGLTAFVHDGYVAGKGLLKAKLFGAIKVMEQPGSPELNQGELMRFLAEAAWYPTKLLPGDGLSWEAIDETSARATLTDGDTTVELVFTFDEQGMISSVRSAARYREVNGTLVATPWEGRFWNYQENGGMLIPTEGEVAWLLPEGDKPYWRARIEQIEYEFVK
ncbi:MAG TPA: hypothetical protein GXX29_00315 [Firmicutes bacterium]|nr:hypothetical protein [Bacillota bacterium]